MTPTSTPPGQPERAAKTSKSSYNPARARAKHRYFGLRSLLTGQDSAAETEAEIERIYGRDENGDLRVNDAAKSMGVKPSTVEKWLSKPDPSVEQQLADVYGRTKQGRLDTKAAAEGLGVSRRTVQRWAKTGKLPASAAGQQAQASVASWRDSPQGRRQQMGEARIKRLSNGFKARTTGLFRVSEDKRGRRDVLIDVAPEQAEAMIDAYLNGDERGMSDAFNESAAGAFGWGSVEVEISSIRLD